MVGAATPFSSFIDLNPGGRAVYGPIAPDTSANNSGTAVFYRWYKADGTTVRAQGTVGTSDADLILNNVVIVAGAPVSVASGGINLPEGP
jgi:hypothetical protein